MNILMVTPMPPQPQAPGAIPLVLHAQLAGLAPHHKLTLVTIVGDDPAEAAAVERLRESGVEVHAARLIEPAGLRRWQRRWRLASDWLGGRYPWRTAWFRAPQAQRILDRLLAERRFDLVQVEDSAAGAYRYRTQVPVVFTEYEVRRPRPIDWSARSRASLLRWALGEADWRRWPRYHTAVWRRFDRIQVFSPRDAGAIAAIAPELADRVRVNPFSVELGAAADPGREEHGALLFVGNFTHAPNVDAALWLGREIMPLLRARSPGVRLTIVGICPPEAVRALACDDIVVTGPVPEIEPFVERAAVVLAPLRIGGGMRMKVLHSMGLGKAVVTTLRGAEGLAVDGRRPPLALAEDAEGIAGAAAALLAADDERRALGRAARAFVAEHHSPSAYVRRLEALYAELLPAGSDVRGAS